MRESPGVLNDEAIKLSQSGLYTEAIACFKRALILEKDNWLIWYNMGLTLRDAGRLEDAASALEKAASYEDSLQTEDVMEALSVIYFELHDFEKAKRNCLSGLEANPVNAKLWNTLGAVYFNEGNYVDAMESFESAVSINPYYPEALFNLKDTYIELKNEKGARECDEKLKSIKIEDKN